MSAVGYPDFRRQQDADSNPVFASALALAANGALQEGPYYVGNFSYVSGGFLPINRDIFVTVEWAMDPSFAVVVGTRSFTTTVNIALRAQFHIRNMGRFVRFTFDPTGALAWTGTFTAFGSNRQSSGEFLPTQPRVCIQGPAALAVAATQTNWFTDYASGTVQYTIQTQTEPGRFTILALQAIAAPYIVFRQDLAAFIVQSVQVAIPMTACECTVQNTGAGVAGYTAVVSADTSGK